MSSHTLTTGLLRCWRIKLHLHHWQKAQDLGSPAAAAVAAVAPFATSPSQKQQEEPGS